MAHDIFVCHSSEDRPVANLACTKLEAAGLKCWIAPRDPIPGIPYGRQLVDAISTSTVVLLIFSSDSNKSEHVLRELELAADRNKMVVPFRIQDVLPSGDLEYYIRRVHWLDALSPPYDEKLDELVVLMQRIIGYTPAKPASAEPTKRATRTAVAPEPPPAPKPPELRVRILSMESSAVPGGALEFYYNAPDHESAPPEAQLVGSSIAVVVPIHDLVREGDVATGKVELPKTVVPGDELRLKITTSGGGGVVIAGVSRPFRILAPPPVAAPEPPPPPRPTSLRVTIKNVGPRIAAGADIEFSYETLPGQDEIEQVDLVDAQGTATTCAVHERVQENGQVSGKITVPLSAPTGRALRLRISAWDDEGNVIAGMSRPILVEGTIEVAPEPPPPPPPAPKISRLRVTLPEVGASALPGTQIRFEYQAIPDQTDIEQVDFVDAHGARTSVFVTERSFVEGTVSGLVVVPEDARGGDALRLKVTTWDEDGNPIIGFAKPFLVKTPPIKPRDRVGPTASEKKLLVTVTPSTAVEPGAAIPFVYEEIEGQADLEQVDFVDAQGVTMTAPIRERKRAQGLISGKVLLPLGAQRGVALQVKITTWDADARPVRGFSRPFLVELLPEPESEAELVLPPPEVVAHPEPPLETELIEEVQTEDTEPPEREAAEHETETISVEELLRAVPEVEIVAVSLPEPEVDTTVILSGAASQSEDAETKDSDAVAIAEPEAVATPEVAAATEAVEEAEIIVAQAVVAEALAEPPPLEPAPQPRKLPLGIIAGGGAAVAVIGVGAVFFATAHHEAATAPQHNVGAVAHVTAPAHPATHAPKKPAKAHPSQRPSASPKPSASPSTSPSPSPSAPQQTPTPTVKVVNKVVKVVITPHPEASRVAQVVPPAVNRLQPTSAPIAFTPPPPVATHTVAPATVITPPPGPTAPPRAGGSPNGDFSRISSALPGLYWAWSPDPDTFCQQRGYDAYIGFRIYNDYRAPVFFQAEFEAKGGSMTVAPTRFEVQPGSSGTFQTVVRLDCGNLDRYGMVRIRFGSDLGAYMPE